MNKTLYIAVILIAFAYAPNADALTMKSLLEIKNNTQKEVSALKGRQKASAADSFTSKKDLIKKVQDLKVEAGTLKEKQSAEYVKGIKSELFVSSNSKSEIRNLQGILRKLGYRVNTNGKFDLITLSAVEDFQKDQGLIITGKVDEKTKKALGNEMLLRELSKKRK